MQLGAPRLPGIAVGETYGRDPISTPPRTPLPLPTEPPIGAGGVPKPLPPNDVPVPEVPGPVVTPPIPYPPYSPSPTAPQVVTQVLNEQWARYTALGLATFLAGLGLGFAIGRRSAR